MEHLDHTGDLILGRTFSAAPEGYDRTEVLAFLAEIAAAWNERPAIVHLAAEKAALRRMRADGLEAQQLAEDEIARLDGERERLARWLEDAGGPAAVAGAGRVLDAEDEARRIIEAAEQRAAELAMLQQGELVSGPVPQPAGAALPAHIARVMGTAEAEAAAMLQAAQAEVRAMREEAAIEARRQLAEAEAVESEARRRSEDALALERQAVANLQQVRALVTRALDRLTEDGPRPSDHLSDHLSDPSGGALAPTG